MKKVLSISLLYFFSFLAFGQYTYRSNEKNSAKYMITGGYGWGTSYWNSTMKNTSIYDRYGAKIQSGDFKFKSKTYLRCYDINVMAPYERIMIGLGINFEDNIMDKIDIQTAPDAGVIAFDQKFTLDKIYGLVELPLFKELKHNFMLSLQARFGYYGYSLADRENFFGAPIIPSTYIIGIGGIAQMRVISHIYLYIHPNAEYKHFNNNAIENPGNITHNMVTFLCIGGIRIDVTDF